MAPCSVGADITVVDSTGLVGRYTSIAVDSSGWTHIAYYDSTHGDLRYATNAGGSWALRTLDSEGVVGWSASIAVDDANNVHIGYKDSTNGDLKYATNAGSDWAVSTVDSADDVGSSTSIAVDSGCRAHISYYDSTHGDLKYATNAGGCWTLSTLDYASDVGGSTSIAVDSVDGVHISYGDITGGALKYATNRGGCWTLSIVDSEVDVGSSTSIAVDSADRIRISYYDIMSRDLKHAVNGEDTWSVSTVDDEGDVGRFASMAVDSADNVHISYYDTTHQDLKYATNAGSDWAVSTIDSYDDVGWYTSIAADSIGWIHIGYYDFANAHLKYATLPNGAIPEFSADDITPNTWQEVTFFGSVPDPGGVPLTFTIEFGDGSCYVETIESSSSENFTVTTGHAYTSAETMTARLYVSDGVTTRSSSPLTITVSLNYPPADFELTNISAYTDEPITISVSTDDRDGDDLTFTWFWGDGDVDVTTNVATASHTYRESLADVYWVYVDDGEGHNVSDGAFVDIVETPTQFTLELEAGWNLVTVPMVNHGYKASTLGLMTGDVVAGYNPATKTYDKYYIVGIYPSIYDFDIEPNWGYWIAANSAKSLTLYGELATTTQERIITVPSEGGWALAGLATMETGLWASDFVDGCTDDMVSMVTRWNADTQTYQNYIVQFGTGDFQLDPGDGLFAFCIDSGTLSYDP